MGEVEVLDKETKDGKPFTVVNFEVASKDKEGTGVITNCSAYGKKAKILMEFRKGDFVKFFDKVRTSIDNKGKDHSNVRILSSKQRMKDKEKGSDKSKDSVLVTIQKFKEKDKKISVCSSDCTRYFLYNFL